MKINPKVITEIATVMSEFKNAITSSNIEWLLKWVAQQDVETRVRVCAGADEEVIDVIEIMASGLQDNVNFDCSKAISDSPYGQHSYYGYSYGKIAQIQAELEIKEILAKYNVEIDSEDIVNDLYGDFYDILMSYGD